MELEEFAFVYQDLKEQLKELPSLPLLLKSVEKTTKKLDCFNLYSLIDKRDFDFDLFQQKSFDEIAALLQDITTMDLGQQDQSVDMEHLLQIETRLDAIKEQKIEAFDKLVKAEESIQEEIDILVDQSLFHDRPHVDNEIKEVEEDEEEPMEEALGQGNDETRKERLKKQIDGLNTKIVKINRGKGKWFDGDHKDFIKIYTRCRGDAGKIVEEGQKMLGMKNIEIMDHLEVYERYLQFQKEKKLASEQFRNIKYLEQQSKMERETQSLIIKDQQQKQRGKLKEEENAAKKQQIEEFRRKKAEEREKIIHVVEKEKEVEKKSHRVSVEKKKEIINRNMNLIEQKKEQFKQRSHLKEVSSTSSKINPAVLGMKQTKNMKPRLPLPKVAQEPKKA